MFWTSTKIAADASTRLIASTASVTIIRAATGAPVLLVDLEAHEPELERGANQCGVQVGGLLHVGDARAHFGFGKRGDGVLEQDLFRRQAGEGSHRRCRELLHFAHDVCAFIIGASPR